MAEETPGGCPRSQAWARHLLRLRGLLRARGRERRRVLRRREAAQLLRQLRLRGPALNMSAPALLAARHCCHSRAALHGPVSWTAHTLPLSTTYPSTLAHNHTASFSRALYQRAASRSSCISVSIM